MSKPSKERKWSVTDHNTGKIVVGNVTKKEASRTAGKIAIAEKKVVIISKK